jgi:hypothetical protein
MYCDRFGKAGYQPKRPDAELVFFWHNGLSPVKEEWSINFVIRHGPDNAVFFVNEELGLSFPFSVESDADRSSLSSLEIYRVAFPRYRERAMFYQNAKVKIGDESYPLELVEDINKIARHSLNERMTLEFSKGLLRAALKKAAEHSIRKEDESLGALIGLMNAITEHADIRTWQTLPHNIYYTRVPLPEGSTTVDFELIEPSGSAIHHDFTYSVQKGQTLFHTFSSLESHGLTGRFY